ncbi:MAG: TIGR01620 family protein, partial [Albidovulum sp.]
MTNPNGPVLIEREEAAAIGPDAAPPVPDAAPVPEGRAM